MSPWFRIDNDLIDRNTPARIGPAAMLVLVVLLRYMDPTGRCWPSTSKIAEHTGLSPRYIRECVAQLESAGLVRREEQPGRITVYHLLCLEPEFRPTEEGRNPDAATPEPGRRGVEPGRREPRNQGAADKDIRIKTYEKDPEKESRARTSKFRKPTVEEVATYCKERGNGIDPQYWWDSYEAKGWKIGKAETPMKDWRAAVRTWEHNGYSNGTQRNGTAPAHEPIVYANLPNLKGTA